MALFIPTLQLGPFIFLGFEEPESIHFGKEQSSYKHILIGGGRVIDLLGAGDPDITWTGYFVGATAQYRARYMESLVKAGKPLLLKTSSFIKQVVITSFTYDFHKVFPITYNITLQVIQDLTLPVNFQIPGDITDAINSALIEANDIAILVANPSVTSALALVLIAVEAVGSFTASTNVAINAAISATQGAISATDAASAIASTGAYT